MANQAINPFEEEQPKIVHLEKSQSHYESCRMQMHDIEKSYRRTFLAHMIICILVCGLAVFHVYIAGFDFLSKPLASADNPEANLAMANLAAGIFQIIVGMGSLLIGYLAWANFHTLHIIQACWYFLVTFLSIWRLEYLSAVIGIVGLVFYFFAIREMGHEARLAELDGYPDFQEQFNISQSDIVIQTLLSHKGEHRTKSTLFTTDYSLRRKKKKRADGEPEEKDPTRELAKELRKRLEETEAAKHPAEQKAEKPENAAESSEMQDLIGEAVQKTVDEMEQNADVQADADAIIAQAEAKAKAILAEAMAEAERVKAQKAKKTEQ